MAQDSETQQNSRVHGPPTAAPKTLQALHQCPPAVGRSRNSEFSLGGSVMTRAGPPLLIQLRQNLLTWLGFFSVLFQYSYLARERSQKHQFNRVGMLNFRKTCTLVSQTFELFWTAWKRMENTKLACWFSRFSAHPARLGKSKTTIMRRDLVSLFARPWTSRRGERMKGYERMRELGIRFLSINFPTCTDGRIEIDGGWLICAGEHLQDRRWISSTKTNYTYIVV